MLECFSVLKIDLISNIEQQFTVLANNNWVLNGMTLKQSSYKNSHCFIVYLTLICWARGKQYVL